MEHERKNIANTMEIDSIIREAKGLSNEAPQPPVQSSLDVQKTGVVPVNDIEDQFVLYDDGVKPEKAKNKNGKKAAVLISLIAGVLLVTGIAGFCLYSVLSDFKYASNVYVNDISIGGLTEKEARQVLSEEEARLLNNINIQVKADEKTVVLSKDDFDCTFDTDDVLSKAREYTKETTIKTGEQRYALSVKLSDDSCTKASEKVAKECDQESKEALIEKFDSAKSGIERFVISDSKNGVKVKQDELKNQIEGFFADGKISGVIDASTEIVEPKYSSEYLKKNIKKLSSFTTTSTNDSNGNSNMALALSKCNGSVINPGDVWSFNNCTGNSNLESNGYKPAGVIVNGKHTTGYGGGICQSSTTIYNAAVMAGMEIIERSCHYYKSTYVDAGRDATVDYGNLDLKLKNVFDYQLVMACYMDGVVLHCDMYGIPNPEFDEIKISSSVTSYFSNGFRASASRTFYLDGKKVRTESMPNSTYYTSEPGGSSSSSKPSSKPSASKPETTPAVSSQPEPEPTPEPAPTPEPEPEPTPDPEPAPGEGEQQEPQ